MLTDKSCKVATCPENKARARFSDAGGLYLEAAPSKSKRWFWKFRYGGKEKRLALGSYPEVSLKEAREARDEARKLQRHGTDPALQRQIDRLSNKVEADSKFEPIARTFHKLRKPVWSASYSDRWITIMEKDAFPWLGGLPVAAITTPMLLSVLEKVQARGAKETAHTLRQWFGQVFRYAVQHGYCQTNPVPDLKGALLEVTAKNVAAVVEPKKAGELMRAIAAYSGQPTTRAALQLSALLFQRPGNIRQMRWADIDLERAMWTIPATDMKRRIEGKKGPPHLVPLASQALEVLDFLKPLTGHGEYVFPSLLTGERPMSENTVRTALRRMGYSNDEMTAHGFRAMARTIMDERLGVRPEVIEAQLAHVKAGSLGTAYDRGEFLEQRRQMMARWADYLDELRDGFDQ